MDTDEIKSLIRAVRATSNADLLQMIAKAVEQESMSTYADRRGYRRVAAKHDQEAAALWAKAISISETF